MQGLRRKLSFKRTSEETVPLAPPPPPATSPEMIRRQLLFKQIAQMKPEERLAFASSHCNTGNDFD
jgi:hypothetical protein